MDQASGSSENHSYQYDSHYSNAYQHPSPPNTTPLVQLTPATTFTHPYHSQQPYPVNQESTYTYLTPKTNTTVERDVIEKKLDEIREHQDIGLKILKNMEAKLIAIEKANNPSMDDFELPDGFPLQSMDDFNQFEEDSDKKRAETLRDYLKFAGGHDLREALHNFVRAAMTEELAEKFTWTGKSGPNSSPKKKFKGTKMMKVFMSAAKRIKKIKTFTLNEFTSNFSEVLRSYKQISKALKKKRANRGQNEEDSYLLSDDEDNEAMMDENLNERTSKLNPWLLCILY
ncbi:uncharacterized protein [Chelonus insularis]|uniref:uncharacterized protein n=1 Tax=Chelonus insularis TaxID=460826 RepID=UPI00158D9BA2|nr:uncharacterized protein LOC118066008 [Chelonus insularis]XP_034937591.1 uncharacterized protein LOC118066008 [Chelonus insularis]